MTIYFTPSICQILEINNLYGRNSPKEEICVSISPKRETEATKTRTLCPQQLDAETVVSYICLPTFPLFLRLDQSQECSGANIILVARTTLDPLHKYYQPCVQRDAEPPYTKIHQTPFTTLGSGRSRDGVNPIMT